MTETNYLKENITKIEFKENGIIQITDKDNNSPLLVRPRRLFPLTQPDRNIVFIDNNNQEVGIIKDSSKLDCDSKKSLDKALLRHYVIPVIKKIDDIKEQNGIFNWSVYTDRGQRDFQLRHFRISVKLLNNNKAVINDCDNNKYEIPDINKLDKTSRKKLFAFIA